MSILRVWFVAALAVAPLFSVDTKSWLHNSRDDFGKGTVQNLSVRSDGRLTLAPAFNELADPSIAYLWTLAVDSKGNVYAGGGGPSASSARLLAVDPNGKSRTVADLPGLQIQAIAIDRRDRVYAATAPDGKVYRVAADGSHEVFYEPETRYIWAIAFNSRGDLFVATGDTGEIHRVTPDGKGQVFFRTEETHARSLAIDEKDNLIVGTEPGGLIVRVSPAGEGFVLYQAAKREVTSVAVASDGTIYAAAVGNKVAAPTPASGLTIPIPTQPPKPAQTTPSGQRPTVQPVPISPVSTTGPSAAVSIAGGSEVFRIGTDDYAQRVWSHPQDVVYSIVMDVNGRPVLGTGNRGNIYRIDSEIISTLLIDAAPTQITALARGPNGRLFAATGNVGRVYRIGPEVAKHGTYESDPLDVGSFAWWGRVTHKAERDNGQVRVETRSGNLDRPQKNWSEWAPLEASSRITSPSARFLQYRLRVSASPEGHSPELREVEVSYMARNVAPSIEEIEITPANYRFTPPTTSPTPAPRTITLQPLGRQRRAVPTVSLDSGSSSQTMQHAPGHVGARWAASDPNSDELLYKVEIRGVNEREWKLLRDKVRERFVSWDSTAYPDGEYVLRLTAADLPDNPPDQAQTTQLESERFTIDNTAPEITELAGTRSGNSINVKWRARDARSIVRKAEYSVNGGDWVVAQPNGRLSDSAELEYAITVDSAGPESTVAVRVTDEYENQGVEKVIVR